MRGRQVCARVTSCTAGVTFQLTEMTESCQAKGGVEANKPNGDTKRARAN